MLISVAMMMLMSVTFALISMGFFDLMPYADVAGLYHGRALSVQTSLTARPV